MEYTNVALELTDARWKDVNGRSYYIANTCYQGETLELTKVKANIISGNDLTSIGDHMYSVLISNSKSGTFTRVTEMGENYAVYEEMYYDEYNECYQGMKYLVIVDSLACVMFSALLG